MNRSIGIGLGVGSLAALLTVLPASAATLHWGGGDGNWETAVNWLVNGVGEPVAWSTETPPHAVVLDGDGGVIGLTNNTTSIETGGIGVLANGYTISPGGSSAKPLVGDITIADGVTLGMVGGPGTRGIVTGNISGPGTLNLLSLQETPSTQRLYVRLSGGSEVSTDVVITAIPNGDDEIVPGSGRRAGFEAWSGGVVTVSGNITNSAEDSVPTMFGSRGTLTVTGVVSGTNGIAIGSENLGNASTGVVVLQNQNTYGGDTHLVSAPVGTLRLNSGTAFTLPVTTRLVWGSPVDWNLGTHSAGRVDLNGHDQQVVALVRTTTGEIGGITNLHATDDSTLTLSGAAGQDGDYTGPITGAINLVKAGNNTQILGGTAAEVTYTGTTTVTGGTLVINGDFSAASGAVTVTGGTLAGNGTIGGATTIAAGGAHNAGNSPGQQTFNSTLTYEAGATLVWELVANDSAGAGVTFDHILANGGFSIADAAVIDLVFNLDGSTVDFSDAFWAGGPSWQIIAGAGTGTFHIGSVSTDALGASLAGSFVVTNEVDGVYLNYVIPEPASFLLLAMGGLAVMGRGRRA